MSTVDEVLSAAMALPAGDRATIADRLFESLDENQIQTELHAQWHGELSGRMKAIDEGTATFVDGQQAVQDIRKSLAPRGGG